MLYLCSASPTRAHILTKSNIAFEQISSDFDEESIKVSDPLEFAFEATKGKLESLKYKAKGNNRLLFADSVIASSCNRLIRKPTTINEARAYLDSFSNSSIAIITVAMLYSTSMQFIDADVTYFDFAPFDKEDMELYLSSKEWQGKAGGCMIEGFCAPYIKSMRGLQSTAMGLQIERIAPWL